MLLSIAFNSVKEINRLREKLSKLLSKGMSNIYLKEFSITLILKRVLTF